MITAIPAATATAPTIRANTGRPVCVERLFQAEMKRHGAERPGPEFDGTKSDRAHKRSELGRLEETGHGFWEIAVSGAIAGDQATDPRQDIPEIPAVKIAEKALWWLSEFEDGKRGARFQDAVNFAEAGFVVGEIAETERSGDEIERLVREGEAQSIRFEKRDRSPRKI